MKVPPALARIVAYSFVLLAASAFDGGECGSENEPSGDPSPPTLDWKYAPEELHVSVDIRFQADTDPALESTDISIELVADGNSFIGMVDSRFSYNGQQYPFEAFPGLLAEGVMTYEDVARGI